MLHTDADFLSAIASQPTDRTLRLVYADWLDEQSDAQHRPADCADGTIGAGRCAEKGELVRIEEEMRALPVFSDRFWELKPRRNALRAQIGAEWCGKMRYGTECESVFRHGIPDGWRERWRLIREFTERWHQIAMPDVGRHPTAIIEAEVRVGQRLPPSVREWIAFTHDSSNSWHKCEVEAIDNGQSVLLDFVREYGVRIQDFASADPFVCAYERTQKSFHRLVLRSTLPVHSSVTEFALHEVVRISDSNGYYLNVRENEAVVGAVERELPLVARLKGLAVHEGHNVLATIDQPVGVPRSGMLWIKVAPALDLDTLPAPLRDFIREWNRRRAAGEPDPIPF